MQLQDRYFVLKEKIVRSCHLAGRNEQSVNFIAVSKTVDIAAIQAIYDLGHRDFGESRFQEWLTKKDHLPKDIRWHFIGNLQSNKAAKVALEFTLIHSLCRESQVQNIEKAGIFTSALIEVNMDNEPTKDGVSITDLEAFVALCMRTTHVKVEGLMMIGDPRKNKKSKENSFKQLHSIFCRYSNFQSLSMGMSDDFEDAIQEGSTHVRIGSALFGERN